MARMGMALFYPCNPCDPWFDFQETPPSGHFGAIPQRFILSVLSLSSVVRPFSKLDAPIRNS